MANKWLRRILYGQNDAKLEYAAKTLFDKNGRRIPPKDLKGIRDSHEHAYLVQPQMTMETDYAKRLQCLHTVLKIDTGITAAQFKQKIEYLRARIRNSLQVANIANGIWLPIVVPKLDVFEAYNLGAVLERYVEAARTSYYLTFGSGYESDRTYYRKFENYAKGKLAGQVSAVENSRQDSLIRRMERGPVIAIHFPYSLQGFWPNASREQMAILPQGFILSGLDTAIAVVMYPDILVQSASTPKLMLAALSWQSARYLPFFCNSK